MSVVVSLSIHAKLAIVVGEEVSPRAEIELLEYSLHPANVLPHHVFSSNLEGLREVVKLLIFGSFFKMFWFRLTCPLHVPFRAVRTDDSHSSCLERVDHGVVDVSCLRYFKA